MVTNKTKKPTTKKKPVQARKKTVTKKNKSLLEKVRQLRTERKERKAEAKLRKQTEKARQEKAKQRAVREKALEQVQEAVDKSKRRKSRPLLTLLLAISLAGLGALAMYQYSQLDIDDKNEEITQLENEIESFADEKAAIEQARQAEEAKFRVIEIGETGSMRVPTGWEEKATSFPLEEVIVGDENVSITIVNSETRNDVDSFIPTVDYVWTVARSATGAVEVLSKSLHCERFDTFDNDLTDIRREHQGFTVYCDDSAEEVNIAILESPDSYGLENSGDYFLVSIKDIQQTSFDAVRSYIESFSSTQ